MKNRKSGIFIKLAAVLAACFLLASFSPSLDGRAVVVDDDVFPKGLFAKTVGYLPGDIISVTNISGDSNVDLLVIGTLDPSDGVAIQLSPEAAKAIGIKKGSNTIVKITKRSGQDERVYGTAVIAKKDDSVSSVYEEPEEESESDGLEESDGSEDVAVAQPFAEMVEETEENQEEDLAEAEAGAEGDVQAVSEDAPVSEDEIAEASEDPEENALVEEENAFEPETESEIAEESVEAEAVEEELFPEDFEEVALEPVESEEPLEESDLTLESEPFEEVAEESVESELVENEEDSVALNDENESLEEEYIDDGLAALDEGSEEEIVEEALEPALENVEVAAVENAETEDSESEDYVSDEIFEEEMDGSEVALSDFDKPSDSLYEEEYVEAETLSEITEVASPFDESARTEEVEKEDKESEGVACCRDVTDTEPKTEETPEEPFTEEPIDDIEKYEAIVLIPAEDRPPVAEETAEEEPAEESPAETPVEVAVVSESAGADEVIDVEDVENEESAVVEEPKPVVKQKKQPKVIATVPAKVVTKSAEKAAPAKSAEVEEHEAIVLSSPVVSIPAESAESAAPVAAPSVTSPSVTSPVSEASKNLIEKHKVSGPEKLEKSKYYIQIAAMSTDEGILEIINKYGSHYPITIVPLPEKNTNQILIGPVTMDEYKVILERFKAYGYKDAFLKKIK